MVNSKGDAHALSCNSQALLHNVIRVSEGNAKSSALGIETNQRHGGKVSSLPEISKQPRNKNQTSQKAGFVSSL